ncbi:MAG: outer membrane protein assembly factor BamC [Halioglobus sp.]
MQEAPEGYFYLRLALPFDRAWASLDRALKDSAFEITDKDRSSGIYYVRFRGEAAAAEKGWWASLWNSDAADPLAGQMFLVTVQSLPDEQAVTIKLRPQDEVPFDKREQQQLLVMIKGNID